MQRNKAFYNTICTCRNLAFILVIDSTFIWSLLVMFVQEQLIGNSQSVGRWRDVYKNPKYSFGRLTSCTVSYFKVYVVCCVYVERVISGKVGCVNRELNIRMLAEWQNTGHILIVLTFSVWFKSEKSITL